MNPAAPAPELQLDVDTTPAETKFHCTGRITSSTSALLRDAVRAVIPEKKTIVLDLSKVTFIDSSGLGTLVSVWVSTKKNGCELRFVNLNQRLKELLGVTSLDKLFAISRFPDTPSF